ncbi:MAG: LysR family transcriptional regulator [Agarilytica sp.]
MSTVKQVRAFVAVAKTQSFAEACGVINLSQPALSIAIKNLESEVGGPLLTRTTRTLSLTPEGVEFLPVAERLLHDWDSAFDDIHNLFSLRRGKISIAAMPSFACNLLPQVFVEYRKLHPGVNISVQDVIAEEVVALVRSGRMEIGISFDPGDSEDLKFTPLFQDQFIAVLPSDSAYAQDSTITWEILLRKDFIALQKPASIRALLEHTLSKHDMNLSVTYETNQLATIGRMVASGLGVSAVPALCESQMQEMGAVCLPIENPAVMRQVGIITRRRYPLSIAASALQEVMLNMWPTKKQDSTNDY